MNYTKLVCTLGPASLHLIEQLIEAGMDVARINLSHSTESQTRAAFESIRLASENTGAELAILADLPGPKVRIGALSGGELTLEAGQVLRLNGNDGIPTTYERLGGDLRRGDRVLLADGAAELRVVETGDDVVAEVTSAGSIRSGAGINIPSGRLSLPPISDTDLVALSLALELGADYIAQSFVRKASDVHEMASRIEGRARLIAKIETKSAVDEFDEILRDVDAVMVARGDLGVDMPFEQIPLIQKNLVMRCLNRGVPSIVATQMLESMTSAPRPTRAEASDVANAVLDGADCMMLSGETAIGRFPLEAARAAVRIADAADRSGSAARPSPRQRRGESEESAIAQAAVSLAQSGVVDAIACFTHSGSTARLIAATRPAVPIYAFSPDRAVLRGLCLHKAVQPRTCVLPQDIDSLISVMETRLRDEESVAPASSVLMVGAIGGPAEPMNFFKIHRMR